MELIERDMPEGDRQRVLAMAEDAASFFITPLMEVTHDENELPETVGTVFMVFLADVEGNEMAVRMPPEAMQKFTEMAAQTWVAYAMSVGLPVVPPPAPGLVLPNG